MTFDQGSMINEKVVETSWWCLTTMIGVKNHPIAFERMRYSSEPISQIDSQEDLARVGIFSKQKATLTSVDAVHEYC